MISEGHPGARAEQGLDHLTVMGAEIPERLHSPRQRTANTVIFKKAL